MLTTFRSVLFAVAFYGVTAVMAVGLAPGYLLLPERQVTNLVRLWGRVSLAILRVVAGVRMEVRGRENIPAGAAIVASKHQSAFETLALMQLLPFPTYVMKRELKWIPLFGLYTMTSGMIHVDRRKGAAALRALVARAREELAKDRQIIIFPEGTRRTPGAAPEYQTGIGLLYRSLDVPVVPVALNSGLYWPRRSWLRYPGTIIVEFLPPIAPGLDSKTFLKTLEAAIEPASDRLLAEAARAARRPPFPDEAKERVAALDAR